MVPDQQSSLIATISYDERRLDGERYSGELRGLPQRRLRLDRLYSRLPISRYGRREEVSSPRTLRTHDTNIDSYQNPRGRRSRREHISHSGRHDSLLQVKRYPKESCRKRKQAKDEL